MPQDGIRLLQDEVSILKLGELLMQTGGLEQALQSGLFGTVFILPALALVIQQYVHGLTALSNWEVDNGVRWHGHCPDGDMDAVLCRQ